MGGDDEGNKVLKLMVKGRGTKGIESTRGIGGGGKRK